MEFKAKLFNELSTREIYEIVWARQEIFLMEQRIVCRDFDGVDYDALHCFIWNEDKVVAYLRGFIKNGDIHLGRFLTLRHGEGLGRRLMELSQPEIRARLGGGRIVIHAQKHAEGFYQKLGFVTVSEVFLEEGVEHVEMQLD